MAAGLRDGWSDVFLSDEKAYEKNATQLKSMFQSLTGKSEPVAEKMATTFKALCLLADFSASSTSPGRHDAADRDEQASDAVESSPVTATASRDGRIISLHSDVHVHLPPTTDVAVYTAIFRALREELLD
jgi:hypothetical protein